jgi:hypothetical protein
MTSPVKTLSPRSVDARILRMAGPELRLNHSELPSFISTPAIDKQLDDIRKWIALENRYQAVLKEIDLHETGLDSYFKVLRDARFNAFLFEGDSDEIRVYDVIHGRLSLRFDFQPKNLRHEHPDASQAYEFGVRSYRDVNGDRIRDIVAGASPSQAAVGTLAYRLVSYWLPLPAGAVAAGLHRRRCPHCTPAAPA